MSIQYIPLGIPFSSSYAVSTKLTLTTSAGGFPVSASYAVFATSSVGPKGADATTVIGRLVSKSSL